MFNTPASPSAEIGVVFLPGCGSNLKLRNDFKIRLKAQARPDLACHRHPDFRVMLSGAIGYQVRVWAAREPAWEARAHPGVGR